MPSLNVGYISSDACCSGERPPIVYSLPRMSSGPTPKPASVGSSVYNREPSSSTAGYMRLAHFPHRLAMVQKDGQVFRAVDRDSNRKTESRLIPFNRLDSRNVVATSSSGNQPISLQRVRQFNYSLHQASLTQGGSRQT